MVCHKYSAHDDRPGRRRGPGGDDGDVVRSGGRAHGARLPRGGLDVRAVRPLRPGDAARRAGVRRVPAGPLAARRHRPALRRRARRRRRRRRVRDGRHEDRARRPRTSRSPLPTRTWPTTACPTTSRSSPSRRSATWRWASIRRRSPPSTTRATSSSSPSGSTAAARQALAKVRHGNAVMLTCRPFGAGGGQVLTVGSTDWVFGLAHDAGVQRCHEQRGYPVVRMTQVTSSTYPCPHDERQCRTSLSCCIRHESSIHVRKMSSRGE